MTVKTLLPQRSPKYLWVGIQQRPGASSPFWIWTLDMYQWKCCSRQRVRGESYEFDLKMHSRKVSEECCIFYLLVFVFRGIKSVRFTQIAIGDHIWQQTGSWGRMIFMLIRIAYCHSHSGNNFTMFAFLLKEFKWISTGISPFSGSSTKSVDIFYLVLWVW